MKHKGNVNECIGCKVTSCRYNSDDSYCELEHIEIKPCRSCGTGKPDDESFCGSYSAR